MRILFAISEACPYAKTGGLADVGASLPKALASLGHEIVVVLPKYGQIDEGRWNIQKSSEFGIKLGGSEYRFSLWRTPGEHLYPETVFLGHEEFFSRDGIYQSEGRDFADNLVRFAAFSRAVLEVPEAIHWMPDVVHANDWQTALVVAYLKVQLKNQSNFRELGSLFTIHNLGYPGLFPFKDYPQLGFPDELFRPEALEFYGQINLIKAGIIYADIVSTVSPTYCQEIQTQENGTGLHGLLRHRSKDLYGVLNGIDQKEWDPWTDQHIAQKFKKTSLKGKRQCKVALQQELNLPVREVPVLATISRLAHQKGIDLLLECASELLYEDLQLVVLGGGEATYQTQLNAVSRRYPEKVAFRFRFDEGLAHRIQSGSDVLIMPSRYEPCGLTQMYSLRYGTIPIVRKTGGLADTVVDAVPSNIQSGRANGFFFKSADSHSLLTAIRLALKLYQDRPLWKGLVQSAMSVNYSWEVSASKYVDLYKRAIQKARLSE